jgi:hypothetical protein
LTEVLKKTDKGPEAAGVIDHELKFLLMHSKNFVVKGFMGKPPTGTTKPDEIKKVNVVLGPSDKAIVLKRCRKLQNALHFCSKYVATSVAILERDDAEYAIGDFDKVTLQKRKEAFYHGKIAISADNELKYAKRAIDFIADSDEMDNKKQDTGGVRFYPSWVTKGNDLKVHPLLDAVTDLGTYFDPPALEKIGFALVGRRPPTGEGKSPSDKGVNKEGEEKSASDIGEEGKV